MNTYYIAGFPISDELYHHGILGQKWGVRRYQNPDGTLTPAGKARYGTSENFDNYQKLKTAKDQYTKAYRSANKKKIQALSPSKKQRDKQSDRIEDYHKKALEYYGAKKKYGQSKVEAADKIKEARRATVNEIKKHATPLMYAGQAAAAAYLSYKVYHLDDSLSYNSMSRGRAYATAIMLGLSSGMFASASVNRTVKAAQSTAKLIKEKRSEK